MSGAFLAAGRSLAAVAGSADFCKETKHYRSRILRFLRGLLFQDFEFPRSARRIAERSYCADGGTRAAVRSAGVSLFEVCLVRSHPDVKQKAITDPDFDDKVTKVTKEESRSCRVRSSPLNGRSPPSPGVLISAKKPSINRSRILRFLRYLLFQDFEFPAIGRASLLSEATAPTAGPELRFDLPGVSLFEVCPGPIRRHVKQKAIKDSDFEQKVTKVTKEESRCCAVG